MSCMVDSSCSKFSILLEMYSADWPVACCRNVDVEAVVFCVVGGDYNSCWSTQTTLDGSTVHV